MSATGTEEEIDDTSTIGFLIRQLAVISGLGELPDTMRPKLNVSCVQMRSGDVPERLPTIAPVRPLTSALYRRIAGENRDMTISYLEHLLEEVNSFITGTYPTEETVATMREIRALQVLLKTGFVKGMEALKRTYAEDAEMLGRLDCIIERGRRVGECADDAVIMLLAGMSAASSAP